MKKHETFDGTEISTEMQNLHFELKDNISGVFGIFSLLEQDKKLSVENQYYIKLIKESLNNLLLKSEKYIYNSKPVAINNSNLAHQRFKDLKFKNVRILLVDDNELNNYIMEQIFNRLGIQVDIAFSGEEAIALYNDNNYDIVFMDYLMPEMSGVQTAECIRKINEKGKKQLIIALSANLHTDIKDKFNKLGVELFIYKPIEVNQIYYILYRELYHKII